MHQWVKNVLVFAPLVLAHRASEAALLRDALLAFVAFCAIASTVYVLNDLADVEADRVHPRKRHRPFAAGALSVRTGAAMAAVSLAVGAAIASRLPVSFQLVLTAYFVATSAYSFALKKFVVVDVLVLAGLYTARVFAGSLATGVPISEWFASFSMFLFFSLAILKRASELVNVEGDPPRRGYLGVDREQLFSLGSSSGYIAVLVLALYLGSGDVRRLYTHPERLWLLCPLLLYWVSRMWILARRGVVRDDPVVHAIRDRGSWAVALLAAVVVAFAT